MKHFILIILVCAFQASFGIPEDEIVSLGIIENILLEAKNETTQFREFTSGIVEKFRNRFSQDKTEVAGRIQNLKMDIIDRIGIDVNSSFAGEKITDYCYKTATKNISVIFENATDDILKCEFSRIFYGYTPINTFVEFTIEMGDDLVKFLDSIIETCESREGGAWKVYDCLVANKPRTRILLKALRRITRAMEKLSQKLSNKVLLKTSKCALEATAILDQESSKIIEATRKCILL